MTGLVEVPGFMLDGRGIRTPQPKIEKNKFWGMRELMMISAANEVMLAEVRFAYLHSEEIRTLYATFDLSPQVNSPVQRELRLTVDSTNKCTHFTFPNCPRLSAQIHWILTRHKCETIGHDYLLGLTRRISVPCLGCTYEYHEYRDTP